MNKEKINKILFYLYNYENIDDLIKQRKNEIIDTVNVSSIAWIKSKQGNGNTLEDQVIKLIEDPLILEYKNIKEKYIAEFEKLEKFFITKV